MIFDLFKNEEVKIELSSEDDYKILSDSIQEDYDIEKEDKDFMKSPTKIGEITPEAKQLYE